jgi:hypothetical protein
MGGGRLVEDRLKAGLGEFAMKMGKPLIEAKVGLGYVDS